MDAKSEIAKTVALYVHIPFCVKKCDYCDFFSVACGKNPIPNGYIDAVLSEADFLKQKFKTENFSTIYIGGGTPSLLSSLQIEKLISELKKKSAMFPEEITIEANPQDLTEDFLAAFEKSCGDVKTARLSLGFQSFSDEALKSVGRRTTRADNFSALALLEKKWGGTVSADLIAGLPFETEKSFFEGLEILTSKKYINHISLYSLCVEEETPLFKKIEDGKLPYDIDKADELWISGRDFLEERGFFQYEVSNFAKAGFESKHNKTYWKQQPYFGLGNGGCGTVGAVRFTGVGDVERWKDPSTCAQDDGEIALEIEELDEATREFEFLMLGFRTLEGVGCEEYKKRYGKDLVARLNENDNLLEKWISDGKAKSDGERVALTKKGILFLNGFLSEL